jgi:predicted enzyme related to lactoylglutathione lyase
MGMPRTFVHGQLSYLQIPAQDVARSASFYATVFQWQVDGASFDAAGLFGQFVTDRPPAPEAGPFLWLHVEDVDRVLEHARAEGATVLSTPVPDGPTRRLATFRDPAGNTIGIVSHS